ncbi:histidine kinase [Thermopolyspora sp. NPDC052614]|uniref:sensor histidine kinase n=1 Tax=Thermopolyspora sp. NPDC052614 TaxID=3155682 RepID=UPI0034297724
MTTDDCIRPFPPADRMQGPDARGFYPWLALLGFPLWEAIGDGVPGPLWAAVAGLVAAGALYAVTVRRAFAVPRRPAGPAFPALAALSTLLAAVYGWYSLFILTAIAAGIALRRFGPYVGAGLAAVAVAVEFVRLPPGEDAAGALSLAWGVFTSALVPWIILRLFTVIAQLRRTREELALAAVERERLRFSRDLHDLLGHTLSVMVVKAELIRRLAPRDAEAAARQAADVENIGRQALAEVRAAVTGYRGRGLAAELDAARIALADAGISATIRTVPLDLPPETDALLGWAVREGATNVLRHSGAATCAITLERENGRQDGREDGEVDREIVLCVEDDGHGATTQATGSPGTRRGDALIGLRRRITADARRGHKLTGPPERLTAAESPGNGDTPPQEQTPAPESPGGRHGNGLTGLQERVAAAGGHLTAGPRPGGGFRLSIRVPLTRTSRTHPDDPVPSAADGVDRIVARHGAGLPNPGGSGPAGQFADSGDGGTTRGVPHDAEISRTGRDDPKPTRIDDGPARGVPHDAEISRTGRDDLEPTRIDGGPARAAAGPAADTRGGA